MYLDFFSLKRHPFRITPDPSLFFPGGVRGRGVVLDALVYGITSGEGILKVVGEVGSGKTMLCRMLEESLPENVEIVYLANPNLSARDIVYAIAFELRLEVDGSTDRLMVMQKLQDYLLKRHAEGGSVVVFIEEAQSMPLDTLEEVRLLSNLETHRHKLMQIVMFGQPELDQKLQQKSIRQLKERITHSFNLEPLNEDEIREYLHFRLQSAGCPWPQLFSPQAEKVLAKASDGLTRRINILADKSLLAAYADPNTRPQVRNGAGEIQPMVQAKHVRTAIIDSDYRSSGSSMAWRSYLGYAATLLVGVLLGTVYVLWQGDTSSSQSFLVSSQSSDQSSTASPAPLNLTVTPELSAQASAQDLASSQALGAGQNQADQSTVAVAVVDPGPITFALNKVSSGQVRRIAGPGPALAADTRTPEPEPAPGSAATAASISQSAGQSSRELLPAQSAPVESAPQGQSAPVATTTAIMSARASTPDSLPQRAITPDKVNDATTEQSSDSANPEVVAEAAKASTTPVVMEQQEASSATASAAPSRTLSRLNGLAAARLQPSQQWLNTLSSKSGYSIQMFTARTDERNKLQEYLEFLSLTDLLDKAYLCLISGNRSRPEQWLVFYSEFNGLSDLRRFISAMPPYLQQNSPYARNLNDISCAN